jgi:hypothetical protein
MRVPIIPIRTRLEGCNDLIAACTYPSAVARA